MEFLSSIPAGGTVFNVFTILAGGLLGLFAGRFIPERIHRSIFQCLGLFCTYMGIDMALKMQDVLPVILSLILGTLIGELIDLDSCLTQTGDWVKKKLRMGGKTFTEGFVTATLLYCIGSMAILGAIENGVRNDPALLVTKGILDGVGAVLFAASLGVGVLFSALPVLIYQGTLTFAASWAQAFITPAMLANISGLGGLLILAIGLGLLRAVEIKTSNMLPSLLLIVLFIGLF